MASKALSPRNRAALANRRERPGPHRALLGAASPLKLDDKSEARRIRVLRQGWQEDALSYADAVPELSFAYRFTQNASSRMRWYPAIVNPDDPDGPPIPLKDADGVPDGVKDVCGEAMATLGIGGRALSPIQKALSYNLGVPGECFIVGIQEPSGRQDWNIRSIDEFMVYEDQYKLREVPLDPQGILGWIDIDPNKTYAARLWDPHPRFQKLATSPMRALLDVAEELLLLSRDVRAVARSRLAGAGILKIPEGLRMMSFMEDNADAESDEWFGRFAEIMMTPISEEGVAAAVVPVAVSGEAEALAGLEHLLLDRPFSPLAMELRAEAIGRIATGLDIPREVLEGMSDPNHWGAWLVSDDTFRHHLEPQVITQVDTFSKGYQRPWVQAAGLDQYWIDRLCTWYDPVDLITKPDPAGNAVLAHDRLTLSNAAFNKALGFTEDDLPTPLEMEVRMITKLRSFPPNVLEALIHALDPDLQIPPIAGGGQVPGMGPTGAIQPTEPAAAPGPAPGEEEPTVVPTGGPPPGIAAPATAAPAAPAALPTGPAAASMAAAGPKVTDRNRRLSRKLSEIDRDLRTRVHQAACATMMQMLDRAGAKLRTRVAGRKNAEAKALVAAASPSNRELAATLGAPIVAALGYGSSMALLDPNWDELKGQFAAWVKAAQATALTTACQLGNVNRTSPSAQVAEAKLAAAIGPAWEALEAELNGIAEKLLYNPSPTAKAELNVDPNTVVPTGVVRRALAIAGGSKPRGIVAAAPPEAATLIPTGMGTELNPLTPSPNEGMAAVEVPVSGQIGTGGAISGLLSDAGQVPVSYSWVHGPAMRPFEPHEDLDGTDFTSFTDDALKNDEGWPENDYYFPGDHDGCSCDFTTEWGTPAEAAAEGGDAGATDDLGDGDEGDEEDEFGADDLGEDVDPDLDPSETVQMVRDLTGNAGPVSRAAAERDLKAARATVQPLLDNAREEASGQLERMGTSQIARPQALVRTIEGTKSQEGGEYDWYFQLSSQERDRLRNNGWIVDDPNASAPDQLHQQYSMVSGSHGDQTVDETMQVWLEQTRTIDAVNLLESRGALPGNIDRFGNFDFNSLAPDSPYQVKYLYAPKDQAIDYLSGARASEALEMVESSLTTRFGEPIWNMTFDNYEAEVLDLAGTLETATPISSDAEWGEVYDEATQRAFSRISELVPQQFVPEDGEPDLYAIWSEAQQLARLAGLKG